MIPLEKLPECRVKANQETGEIWMSDGQRQARFWAAGQDVQGCAQTLERALNKSGLFVIDMADMKQWDGWRIAAYQRLEIPADQLEEMQLVMLFPEFRQAQSVLIWMELPGQAGLMEVEQLTHGAMEVLDEQVEILFSVNYDSELSALNAYFLGFCKPEQQGG